MSPPQRREVDPPDSDFSTLRTDVRTFVWKKIIGPAGIAGFLLLYLLNFFHPIGLRSPFFPNSITSESATLGAIRAHEAITGANQRENLRLYRLICRGVWKGNTDMQDACGQ